MFSQSDNQTTIDNQVLGLYSLVQLNKIDEHNSDFEKLLFIQNHHIESVFLSKKKNIYISP